MTGEGPRSHLSFWQIWNMSFGFLGIQFGWALQMANMSAIYEYLGADAHQIPILWLAAPLTGDAARDAAALLTAIRAGHVYTVIDALASPARVRALLPVLGRL